MAADNATDVINIANDSVALAAAAAAAAAPSRGRAVIPPD